MRVLRAIRLVQCDHVDHRYCSEHRRSNVSYVVFLNDTWRIWTLILFATQLFFLITILFLVVDHNWLIGLLCGFLRKCFFLCFIDENDFDVSFNWSRIEDWTKLDYFSAAICTDSNSFCYFWGDVSALFHRDYLRFGFFGLALHFWCTLDTWWVGYHLWLPISHPLQVKQLLPKDKKIIVKPTSLLKVNLIQSNKIIYDQSNSAFLNSESSMIFWVHSLRKSTYSIMESSFP